MDRVRLIGSMWTFELSTWLCDQPAVGTRVSFADLGDAERTLRWILHEDPFAHMRVAALLRELDEPPQIERAAELLERGWLVLYRSVEVMASEPRTPDYRQEYEYTPPVNEIAEVGTWIFWEEPKTEPDFQLDAKHVGEPLFVILEDDGPIEDFVLDAELGPGDDFSLDAELDASDDFSVDAEDPVDGNFSLAVEDEFEDEDRTMASAEGHR